MGNLASWLRSWAVTLRIMIFERDLYRTVRDWQDEPGGDEFVQVFGGEEE
jgi:hypothetical protein